MLTVFFLAYYMKLLARVSFFSESCRDGENGYVFYHRVYNELIIPVRAKICIKHFKLRVPMASCLPPGRINILGVKLNPIVNSLQHNCWVTLMHQYRYILLKIAYNIRDENRESIKFTSQLSTYFYWLTLASISFENWRTVAFRVAIIHTAMTTVNARIWMAHVIWKTNSMIH